MEDLEQSEKFRIKIVGLHVSHGWKNHESTTIFLEFGELSSSFRRDGTPAEPRGEMQLMIEGHWRFEKLGKLLCGSGFEYKVRWPFFQTIIGYRVHEVKLENPTLEISIVLDNDILLRSFSAATANPGWALFDNGSADACIYVRDGRFVVD